MITSLMVWFPDFDLNHPSNKTNFITNHLRMSDLFRKDLEFHLEQYARETGEHEVHLFDFARWLQKTVLHEVDPPSKLEVPAHISRLSSAIRQRMDRMD
jgi:hypothetical protein